jgi:hypothetical protein
MTLQEYAHKVLGLYEPRLDEQSQCSGWLR